MLILHVQKFVCTCNAHFPGWCLDSSCKGCPSEHQQSCKYKISSKSDIKSRSNNIQKMTHIWTSLHVQTLDARRTCILYSNMSIFCMYAVLVCLNKHAKFQVQQMFTVGTITKFVKIAKIERFLDFSDFWPFWAWRHVGNSWNSNF